MTRTVAGTGSAVSTLSARRTTAAPARTTATRGGTATRNQSAAFQKGSDEGTGRPSRTGVGFSAWKATKDDPRSKSSGEYNDFSVEDGKKYLVAFMDDGPFTVVWVHWVPTVNDQGKTYDTPRNCPKSADEDAECPLCDLSAEAKPVAYFNVVDLDEPGKVALWKATKDPAGRIEELYDELQALPSGPLDLNSEGVYAAVSKSKGKNGYFAYKVVRVKERDLAEDHGVKPMTAEQFEALEDRLYTAEAVRYSPLDDLRALAETIED